jgi:hypothetical protein
MKSKVSLWLLEFIATKSGYVRLKDVSDRSFWRKSKALGPISPGSLIDSSSTGRQAAESGVETLRHFYCVPLDFECLLRCLLAPSERPLSPLRDAPISYVGSEEDSTFGNSSLHRTTISLSA